MFFCLLQTTELSQALLLFLHKQKQHMLLRELNVYLFVFLSSSDGMLRVNGGAGYAWVSPVCSSGSRA